MNRARWPQRKGRSSSWSWRYLKNYFLYKMRQRSKITLQRDCWKKIESPSDPSNIFSYWIQVGLLVPSRVIHHCRWPKPQMTSFFFNGICLKTILMETPFWEHLGCYIFCESLELSSLGCSIATENWWCSRAKVSSSYICGAVTQVSVNTSLLVGLALVSGRSWRHPSGPLGQHYHSPHDSRRL